MRHVTSARTERRQSSRVATFSARKQDTILILWQGAWVIVIPEGDAAFTRHLGSNPSGVSKGEIEKTIPSRDGEFLMSEFGHRITSCMINQGMSE